MAPEKVRSVKMSNRLWREVNEEAVRQDRTASWVIRKAIEAYLKREGQP